MSSDAPPAAGADVLKADGRSEWVAEARGLVRAAMTATLATLDRDDGTPYASLVAVATLHDGRPLLLLSRLAVHTRNLEAKPLASLLIDRRETAPEALTASRVTLLGELRATSDPAAKPRYLARHPAAVVYADFADFGFYELAIARGHFVGGFGRITPMAASDLVDPSAVAPDLLAAEPDVLAHMNDDHADAIALMARAQGGGAGPWRLAGLDATGFDLVAGNQGLRLAFQSRVSTPDEVRRAFIALVGQARSTDAAR